ncbi:MAG: glutathione transferase GstA [Steroidobacteraceae bacterium]
MKLYFGQGACSLAPHIALREAGLEFETVKVDIRTKATSNGEDYWKVNGKGYVPALRLDDGQVLTEVTAVLQYIADRKPEKNLAPPAGTMERYRLLEWLGFTSSEIHKGFSPLFRPDASDEVKNFARGNLTKRLAWLEQNMGKGPFLMGDPFTIADAYLFTVAGWHRFVSLDISPYPTVGAYLKRILERPTVRAALDHEKSFK